MEPRNEAALEEHKITIEKNHHTHLALHKITIDILNNRHLNLHILRIQRLYEKQLKFALVCYAQGSTLQKAKTYATILRQEEISPDVPDHIKKALIELVIARYQLNLLDGEHEIITILPPPPESITQSDDYKLIENWSVGLQDKAIQALSGNKILTLSTDVTETTPQITIKEEFEPIINQKKIFNYADLKEKIKKTICDPQAIHFWRNQVWRGDIIEINNNTSRAPTGIKDILDCLASQQGLDAIKNKADQALGRTSIFCCGKPLSRTTATHQYYLLIRDLKYNSVEDIGNSMKILDEWMERNNIKTSRPEPTCHPERSEGSPWKGTEFKPRDPSSLRSLGGLL